MLANLLPIIIHYFLGGQPFDSTHLHFMFRKLHGFFTIPFPKIADFEPQTITQALCYPTFLQHNLVIRPKSFGWCSNLRAEVFQQFLRVAYAGNTLGCKLLYLLYTSHWCIYITCSYLFGMTCYLHVHYLSFYGCGDHECFINPRLDLFLKHCLLLLRNVNSCLESLGLLHFSRPLHDSDRLHSPANCVISLLQLSHLGFYLLYGWVFLEGSERKEGLI